ncbi:MAG: sigma-70 family RNA polymerase sigma factor [Anaerolineales bacterium]|nr:sigma-70 family RNA polymerase sigma factor [Anaerolineales bacterium]
MASESDLLQRARSFDHHALAELYDLYSPGLYRYAMRLLGHQQLSEECVADTFSRLLQALQARKGPDRNIQAYLYRITHNWIVDYYRSHPEEEAALEDDHAGDAPRPEDAAIQNLQAQHLRKVVRTLTQDQQMVIGMKYLEGLDNKTVALALGKPVGAVKSLQHRALASLKKILEDEGFI